MAQTTEHLLCKNEGLNSNPSPIKKKIKKRLRTTVWKRYCYNMLLKAKKNKTNNNEE
jgi:hypothetical protein